MTSFEITDEFPARNHTGKWTEARAALLAGHTIRIPRSEVGESFNSGAYTLFGKKSTGKQIQTVKDDTYWYVRLKD